MTVIVLRMMGLCASHSLVLVFRVTADEAMIISYWWGRREEAFIHKKAYRPTD